MRAHASLAHFVEAGARCQGFSQAQEAWRESGLRIATALKTGDQRRTLKQSIEERAMTPG